MESIASYHNPSAVVKVESYRPTGLLFIVFKIMVEKFIKKFLPVNYHISMSIIFCYQFKIGKHENHNGTGTKTY